MSTVLVTGANGQVGQELQRADWPDGVSVVGLTRTDLDIADRAAVAAALRTHAPEVVVNAAAYTAVDRAEDEAEAAFRVNRDGVEVLNELTAEANIGFIHLSTDYVFDGAKNGWYVETDATNPTGVYGASKAAGERIVLTRPDAIVLRTAWVYGALGPNFVRTMLRLAAERDQLGVVDDQVGTPTAAADIATAIVTIVDSGLERGGLFHCAAPDEATWWDLADAAITGAGLADGVTIDKLTTEQYPTAAARPANSRLASGKLADAYGVTLPPWRTSLAAVLRELTAASDA